MPKTATSPSGIEPAPRQAPPRYSYRMAVVRDVAAYPGLPELCEHVRVHAANATHAQLTARAVTGAAVALEPERLGEVLS